MEFGTYINVLFSTGFFGKSKAKVGQRLFGAAGSKRDIGDSTMKSWISGNRCCRIAQHFPDDSINEREFISFLKRCMPGRDSWKKLQKEFAAQDENVLKSEGFCVDLHTENPEMFYWSLLNQFQKIFLLPASEREGYPTTVSVTKVESDKLSAEHMRALFLESVQNYKVMNIINKKPAVLDRNDSSILNVFLSKMDILIPYSAPESSSLGASIRSFIEALRMQVLSLDATLNNRFGFEDDTAAFVNMEDSAELDKDSGNMNRLHIPELSLELIEDADNPQGLLGIVVGEWGGFRNKMNFLFKEISSWQDQDKL